MNGMLSIGYLEEDELLALPVSVNSFLVLEDYVSCHTDVKPFYKLIAEYTKIIPLWKLASIFSLASFMLNEEDFSTLIARAFVIVDDINFSD